MSLNPSREMFDGRIVLVPLDGLTVHPVADRSHEPVDDELRCFAQSLQEHGQLSPVIARVVNDGDIEVVCGSRRVAASKLAGRKYVSADVREISDAQALELIGVENIIRKNPNPIQLATYFHQLNKPVSEGGAGKTCKEIGEMFGKARTWVSQFIYMLRLPQEWQERIASGEIKIAHAQPFYKITDPTIFRALELAYQKEPKAFANRLAIKQKIRQITEQFQKLNKNGVADIPGGRGIQESRAAAIAPAKRDMYAEERQERQADKLVEHLEETGMLLPECNGHFPDGPLTEDLASVVLANYWFSSDDLRTLAAAIQKRLQHLASAEQ